MPIRQAGPVVSLPIIIAVVVPLPLSDVTAFIGVACLPRSARQPQCGLEAALAGASHDGMLNPCANDALSREPGPRLAGRHRVDPARSWPPAQSMITGMPLRPDLRAAMQATIPFSGIMRIGRRMPRPGCTTEVSAFPSCFFRRHSEFFIPATVDVSFIKASSVVGRAPEPSLRSGRRSAVGRESKRWLARIGRADDGMVRSPLPEFPSHPQLKRLALYRDGDQPGHCSWRP